MNFKENLRDEMDYQDIKPKELSDLTGISINTIRNYINGHNALPSAENAVKIASVLNVSVEYLVTGQKSPNGIKDSLLSDFQNLSENDKKSVLALIKEMLKHY